MNRSINLQGYVGKRGKFYIDTWNTDPITREEKYKYQWVRGEVVGVGSDNSPDDYLIAGNFQAPQGWKVPGTAEISIHGRGWILDEE